MSTATRIKGGVLTPLDWPGLSWFPFFTRSIRVEDYIDQGRYIIRAEVPGIDPAEDLRITCVEGQLRLDVVRREQHADGVRSEFHYGSFFRVIPIPVGVKEETLVACYTDGILEITAEMGEPESKAREIPIKIEPTKEK